MSRLVNEIVIELLFNLLKLSGFFPFFALPRELHSRFSVGHRRPVGAALRAELAGQPSLVARADQRLRSNGPGAIRVSTGFQVRIPYPMQRFPPSDSNAVSRIRISTNRRHRSYSIGTTAQAGFNFKTSRLSRSFLRGWEGRLQQSFAGTVAVATGGQG